MYCDGINKEGVKGSAAAKVEQIINFSSQESGAVAYYTELINTHFVMMREILCQNTSPARLCNHTAFHLIMKAEENIKLNCGSRQR